MFLQTVALLALDPKDFAVVVSLVLNVVQLFLNWIEKRRASVSDNDRRSLESLQNLLRARDLEIEEITEQKVAAEAVAAAAHEENCRLASAKDRCAEINVDKLSEYWQNMLTVEAARKIKDQQFEETIETLNQNVKKLNWQIEIASRNEQARD